MDTPAAGTGSTISSAGHVEVLARALRAAAEQLDEDGECWLADYLHEAADEARRFADSVPDADAVRLLDDLRRAARRNSGAGLGASIAAGIALGRRVGVPRPLRREDTPLAHAQPPLRPEATKE